MSEAEILVVDDDPDIRDIVAFTLEEAGFSVHLAANGRVGLAILEHLRPGLVVLDIEMPGMTGHEVARTIRKDSNVPILFLSSRAAAGDLMKGFDSGADDYVTKPFEPAILVARVTAILRRTAPAALGARKYAKYCPHCLTCVEPGAPSCSECGEEEPGDGWSRIEDSPHSFLGRVVDERYVLDKFVGAGGMGWVYRAQALAIRRQFACKIVEAHRFGSPDVATESLARFNREVDAMSRLQNPHVVSIYETMMLAEGTLALFMDFVSGHTLEELIGRTGRISVQRTLDLLRQVANGVHEAHQVGIIHRDIKPANIMVERLPASGYFARILDFGIARIVGHSSATQGFLGTPMYASPEQCLGSEIDHRSDIYSLGCVMYSCLTGRAPFEGTTAWKVMESQVHGDVPSLIDAVPGATFPATLNELLQRMLQKAPEQRPADMSEVIAEIDNVVAGLGPTRTLEDTPVVERRIATRTAAADPTIGSEVGTRMFDLPLDVEELRAVTLSHDGAQAVVSDSNGIVHIADIASATWTTRLFGGPKNAVELALSPNNKVVFAVDVDKRVYRWDVSDTSTPSVVHVPAARYIDVADDAPSLVIADDQGQIGTLQNGNYTRTLAGQRVTALVAAPSLAVATVDGTVSIIDSKGAPPRKLAQLSSHAIALAMSRDGYLLAVLDAGGTIQILDTFAGRSFFALHAHGGRLRKLAFSDHAQLLGLGVAAGRITLWRLGPQIQD